MAMSHIIVEHSFDKPVTAEELGLTAKRIDACLVAYGATWVRSFVSLDGKRMICEFEAPDAEAVRTSYHNADVKFERVWTANAYSRDA
jgi:hypothetical protein